MENENKKWLINNVFHVLQALDAEDAHNEKVREMMKLDERKRPYNSMFEAKAPTEEELEAFRMKQIRDDDPMAKFFSKD